MIKHKQDHLRTLAERYINNPEFDFETIKKNDITREFMATYKGYVLGRTLVVFNFNGHTTDGKSTVSAALVAKGNKWLKVPMKSEYILGNQQEYAYWVQQNPNASNIFLQIDEWSSLAETGANATIELAYLEELSNIHAQMYVHRSYCSPSQLPDKNILIHFEVASAESGKTVCYVYYNLTRGGHKYPQIIGHIVVDVQPTIDSKWYKEYRRNKFNKIDLLRKHNISHEREIFYAEHIKAIYNKLIGYTQTGKYVSVNTIKAKAKVHCQRAGIRQTMLGIEYTIVEPVKAVLDLYSDVAKTKELIQKLTKEIRKSDDVVLNKDKALFITNRQEWVDELEEDIKFYNDSFDSNIALFKKYKQIGGLNGK